MCYTNVELIGNYILERYVDETGDRKLRKVEYKPTLFHHAMPGVESKYKDIYGQVCVPKKFFNIADARQWMRKMNEIGQEALGMADFTLSYISDAYRKEIHFERENLNIAVIDIEVTAPEMPKPENPKYAIDMISHIEQYKGKTHRYIFDLIDGVSKWESEKSVLSQEELDTVIYMPFETEQELLMAYQRLWMERVPDIVFGWNSDKFDIPYIIQRMRTVLGKANTNKLSPYGKITEKTVTDKYGTSTTYKIHGITCLDYLDVFKKFSFTPYPSYKLGYIGYEEVKVDKLDYEGPINKFRGADHQRYVDYCVRDTGIILAIDGKRCFIDLILALCYYAKIPFNAVLGTIKIWDAILFNSLREEHKVVPESISHHKESFIGAFVKEPLPGAHRYIMSFDLTSLYPSIMRLVNISPETVMGQFNPAPLMDYVNKTAPKPSEEYSCSPNGMMYSTTQKGIIPIEVKKVFDQRKAEKKMMLAAQRNREAIKKILKSRQK